MSRSARFSIRLIRCLGLTPELVRLHAILYDRSLPRISSGNETVRAAWPQVYLGVAITSLGTLLIELALTRVFSVVFYYHFAFLAISIALFGLGAGGIFSYAIAGRGRLYESLGRLALLHSVSVIAALSFLISLKGDPSGLELAGVYFASSLPFFFTGTILSLVIGETMERVDRVYFFDLLGASGGCLLLLPLLNQFGGPNTVLAAAVLFAVASSLWFHLAGDHRGRVAGVAAALCLVALIAYNGKAHWLDIHWAKGQPLPKELYSHWNAFSRIALAPEAGGGGRMSIIIDADAATGIPSFNWDRLRAADYRALLRQGPGLAYAIRPGAKTLVIGPGGGWDVARALASGSKDITGVEINPIIATTIMRQRYPDLSHGLYFRPEVRIVIEDGRSFVRRSPERYQVLQATLVDTWAATAAGAFALSENNLYTTDAFRDYLEHLTPDGLLSFTRWGFDPPRESLRLLALAREALEQLGETDAWRHIMVVREDTAKLKGWGAQDTVLVFRHAVTPTDLDRARAALARDPSLQSIYLPGDPPRNEFGRFLLSKEPEAFELSYPFDVTPVGDDRPFFFYTVQPRDVWSFLLHGGREAADYKINRALPLLFGLVSISLAATAVMLALPPLLLRAKLPSGGGVRPALVYFICIGAGYILIQVALIQKFILFLGHPTYALTVIVFSMLVSSGIGSYKSRGIAGASPRALGFVLCGVALLVILLALAVGPVTQIGTGWPLPAKMLTAIALVTPAGFFMGMPFPTGLAHLEVRYPAAVRWAWALNAAASVMGSAGAIFLAIYIGLKLTLIAGGFLYLGAFAVSRIGTAREMLHDTPGKPAPAIA